MPLRIVVADDHGIVREGLIALLDRQEGMKVVGSAATGRAAVEATERLKPDVVIMDLAMPDWNGIEATQRILSTSPKISVIALSASHTSEHVSRALRAGARGYVVKDAKGAELVEAVKMVSVGRRYLSQRASPRPRCRWASGVPYKDSHGTPERARARRHGAHHRRTHEPRYSEGIVVVAQDRRHLPGTADGKARRVEPNRADPFCDRQRSHRTLKSVNGCRVA